MRREELLQLLEQRDANEASGLQLSYEGQRPPWQIVRRVQPRQQRIVQDLCHGSEDCQSNNLLIEGENLQAMVSLYKYRSQVDLILADPPYNTGKDFRYNDKWDEDPNDPDLGKLVPADEGSRHSKWLRFMTPRLWMMKEMLRPGGVLAICIDHRELFRLGVLLDQIFDEPNRLGIINWQKTTSKNDKKHVASTTEYILIYSRAAEQTTTGLLDRSEKANARFSNVDNDTDEWKQGDPCGKGDVTHKGSLYAIQSPFTGELHYPPSGRHWANDKSRVKAWLEEWGVEYVEADIKDKRPKALLIKGAPIPGEALAFNPDHPALARARAQAESRHKQGRWPKLYFGHTGKTSPMLKVYKGEVKAGSVPTTFWVERGDEPLDIGSASWEWTESGRNREGIEELNRLVGKGHGFETVKPLKLFKKLIQIWCPKDGIVLDPFAGSGTTGHAVLALNEETEASRRFIMIEQGRPERGDPYARSLTHKRLKRAITGEREDGQDQPLHGGFRFVQLKSKVDGEAVLALEREEMIDLLLTTHWDQSERAGSHLMRLPASAKSHLFAVNSKNEGYFLVWNGPNRPSVVNRESYRAIAAEAKAAALEPPYHVYARICSYSGPGFEFYQIPNRILEKLGFNEATDQYTADKE